MNLATESCTREFLDFITDPMARHNAIIQYCDSKFEYVNMVDVYYDSLNQSGFLMALIILLFYPISFVGLATIADRYLSLEMKDLAHKLKLSPTVAAMTLIAFANGAPDVLSSIQASSLESGNLISLGALYGAFIFSSTLVISYVAINAHGDIRLPKLAVIKELGFYLFSIIVVIIFGYIGQTSFFFVLLYWSIYFTYCWATYKLEQANKKEEILGFDLEHEEVKNDGSGLNENLCKKNQKEDVESDQSSDVMSPLFFTRITDKLLNEDYTMFENVVALPLNILAFFTISDADNPFMSIFTEPLICTMSFSFALTWLEIFHWSFLLTLMISIFISIVCYVSNHSTRYHRTARLAYQLTGIFASIAWIKIFSSLIIDFITFIAFYFDVNQVIIAAILLSAGNTIGDLFGNAALAKAGEDLMGTMASYSGQIFNNYIGFSFNIWRSLSISKDFDLFNRFGESTKIPLQNIFVISMMLVTISIILISLVYFFSTGFILKRWFTKVLVSIYVIFFIGSLFLGLSQK